MRLFLLSNGDRVFSPSLTAMILPVGIETVKDIDLSALSFADRETIRENIENDEILNEILSKINNSVAIADSDSMEVERK